MEKRGTYKFKGGRYAIGVKKRKLIHISLSIKQACYYLFYFINFGYGVKASFQQINQFFHYPKIGYCAIKLWSIFEPNLILCL